MCAFILVLTLMPVMVIVYLLILGILGHPAIFVQNRLGIKKRPFNMIKFRTMDNICDHNGGQLADKDRLTSLGKVLRKFSLDELPELFNVIRGEMSLVGPRPLLVEYVDLFSQRHDRRFEVRPGITGWAQINGRNEVDWDERLELDVWYVENHTILLDLKILILTCRHLFKPRGVNQPGHATMSPFQGSTK